MSGEYPFGDEFQKKLLAMYIRQPQQASGLIEPAYFTNPIHAEIARLVSQLRDRANLRDGTLSRHTLYEIVRGVLGRKRAELWPAFRKTIRSVWRDHLEEAVVLREQALAFARERLWREALVEGEKDINAGHFENALRRFDKLRSIGAERDLGIEYWKDPTSPDRWREDRIGQIPTFYLPTLDRMMGGGPGGGELAVVLGKGKAGKSTFLGMVARGALWHGKNIALATGELSAKKYRKRLDASITGYSNEALMRFARHLDEDKRKLSRELRHHMERALHRMSAMHSQLKGHLFIKQWPTNKGKIRDIERWMDEIERERGIKLDMLVVDYIRVFKPNERYEDHRLNIGQVTLDLRGVAVERNIPVWTAQQSRRSSYTKTTLDPSDIAEDISQFWTLDFLIAFCQSSDEEAKGDPPGKEFRWGRKPKPQEARVYLLSARDVMSGGMIPVNIWRDTFEIRQVDRKRV